MTTQELKTQIQKSLEHVPDSVLEDILNYLKLAERQPHEKLSMISNIKQILSEDRELLEKLAK
jgi:hypothetical protein